MLYVEVLKKRYNNVGRTFCNAINYSESGAHGQSLMASQTLCRWPNKNFAPLGVVVF